MKIPAGITLPAIVLVIAALMLGACASAPESTDEGQVTPDQGSIPTAKLQEAKQLKQQVDEYGLSAFAPDAYREAEAKLASGEASMGKDNAAAERDLDAAIAAYRTVSEDGFPRLAEETKQKAEAMKAKAESVKAQNAAAPEYGKAMDAYGNGTGAESRQAYREAVDGYRVAAAAFETAHDVTLQKRERAAQALMEAEERLRQVQTKSQEMDEEIESLGLPATAQ